MTIAVINCIHHKGLEPCAVIGRVPVEDCETCQRREAIERPAVLLFITRETEPPPPPVDKDPVNTLCIERLREEWDREWQKKLRAAAVGRNGRALLIPRALYDEALKNRK